MAFAICMLCGIIILIFLGSRIKENKRRQYELENLKQTVSEPNYGVYHNALNGGGGGKLSALSSPSERGNVLLKTSTYILMSSLVIDLLTPTQPRNHPKCALTF